MPVYTPIATLDQNRKESGMRSILRFVARGALWGMLTWQSYAILEYALGTFAAPLRYPSIQVMIPTWHWEFTGWLFGTYALVGIVAGAICGLLWALSGRDDDTRRPALKTIALLSLAAGFGINLLFHAHHPASIVPSLFSAGLLMWRLSSDSRLQTSNLIENAWAISLFLLISAWITEDVSKSGISAFGWAIVLSGIVLADGKRIRWRLRNRGARFHLRGTAAGFVFVFGSAAVFDHRTQPAIEFKPAVTGQPSRPNIILITMDTVRADHLSLYNYRRDTTPNLDALAAASTVFDRAIAGGNITLLGHTAIFTGKYAASALELNPYRQVGVASKVPTLPEFLLENGYNTAAVVANFGTLQHAIGFDRGFEFFDNRMPLRIAHSWKDYELHTGMREIWNRFTCTAEVERISRTAADINNVAFQVLDHSVASGRPFFLFLNYMDAHWPYLPPAPFDSRYPGKDCSSTNMDAQYQQTAMNLRKGMKPSKHELEEYVSQYDGGIAYIDSKIGELVHRLQRMGVYSNTMIVVTADHGEAMATHGFLGHRYTLYQGEVRVPLLIKYPGNSRRNDVNALVSHVDILPTVLDVAGIASPASIHGHSLRNDPPAPDREVISESLARISFDDESRSSHNIRAIFDGSLKIIRFGASLPELYDLSVDPNEDHNLCATQASRCSEMESKFGSWARIVPSHGTWKPSMDRDSLERLRSLGYVR